MKETMQIK